MIDLLITRPRSQAQKTADWFEQKGVNTYCLPLLDIQAVPATVDVPQQPAYQHIIFISANAVMYAREHMPFLLEQHAMQCWAIGDATAQALREQGFAQVKQAQGQRNSEALLASPELQDMYGQRVLIYRGEGGRQHLAAVLAERGADVEYCELYSRTPISEQQLQSALPSFFTWRINTQRLIVMVLSVETLETYNRYASQLLPEYKEVPLLVPSERVKKMAETLGYQQILCAEYASFFALYETITNATQI